MSFVRHSYPPNPDQYFNIGAVYLDPGLNSSLGFNGHFPGGSGLASTFLDFTGAKDDGGDGDNWSYKTRKAPLKLSPPTNQPPTFLESGCPSCGPTNSMRSLNFYIFIMFA